MKVAIKGSKLPFTLQEFSDGKVALHNNGSIEDLREILNHCFPNDKSYIAGVSRYYFTSRHTDRSFSSLTNLPTQDTSIFMLELNAIKHKNK